MEIHLPEVEQLTRNIEDLIHAVQQLMIKIEPAKLWYSRAELAAIKGIPVSAFYNKPWLLPGKPHKQAGVDRWSFKQVWDSGWIWKSDVDLNAKEGKRDGTRNETSLEVGAQGTPAALRRMRRQRLGALSGQSE